MKRFKLILKMLSCMSTGSFLFCNDVLYCVLILLETPTRRLQAFQAFPKFPSSSGHAMIFSFRFIFDRENLMITAWFVVLGT